MCDGHRKDEERAEACTHSLRSVCIHIVVTKTERGEEGGKWIEYGCDCVWAQLLLPLPPPLPLPFFLVQKRGGVICKFMIFSREVLRRQKVQANVQHSQGCNIVFTHKADFRFGAYPIVGRTGASRKTY